MTSFLPCYTITIEKFEYKLSEVVYDLREGCYLSLLDNCGTAS